MTSTAAPATARPSLAARPRRCRNCGAERAAGPVSICEQCLGPLDPVYEPGRRLPDRQTIAARAPSLWRYREWLPFDGEPVLSLDSGFTPLFEAPALARGLGVAGAWVKTDTACHPSRSFKDRVVAAAINAAAAFGLDTFGCASTGNLANAVAAHAARAGLKAWIFVPETLETPKVIGTAIYGPRLVRVRGTYDDVNRLCAQVADRFGWGMVNVNLRCYYGEGSKTLAYEIAEQLGWRLPTAVVAPMAGGSLVTRLRKGFAEFLAAGLVRGTAPRLYGAQADGCAPIVRLVERGGTQLEPEVPNTICRSLAIGSPADGVFAARAVRESGGWAAAVSDTALVDGIRFLAQDTGVFAETAGAVTAPSDRDWLFAGFVAACRGAGCKVPGGVMIDAASEIPIGRGLGSSGAATVAGALAARALLGLELDDAALARLCADVEHHPDNVAPAIYGGAVLAVPGPEGRLTVAPLEVHGSLVFVFAVPDFAVETEQARAALPSTVSHRTADTAAAKAAALVAGLARADAPLLAAALDDVLHAPHRRSLVRGYDAVTAAARAAGAFGATLSGSGSSILAVTPAFAAKAVATTMARVWGALDVTAETFVIERPASRYDVTSLTQETLPCPSR